MTPAAPGDGRELLGGTLYDITQLLESAEDADQRVRRVLELLHDLVPYQQCAMLEAQLGHEPHIVGVPETPPDAQALLTDRLVDIFGQLVGADARTFGWTFGPPARSEGAHLAVPLVGLDQVIGLLFVQSAVAQYDERHLRVLSVVAAKLAAYFTMLRARTELAELADGLDKARRAAEAANRAKDEFLALISYELKTPLVSILAAAHALGAATTGAARAAALADVERHVDAQAKLIDDILDLACVASAELRLSLRTVEPAALIEATIEGLRLDAQRKSIRLGTDLDRAAMPLVLDAERINQVISILVANAIKFTPAGGHVDVRLDRAAGYARIRVSDSGAGISPEALPHVFDRFRPTVGADAHAERGLDIGLGVGLAIAKNLVERHGGRVGVESAGPQRGATFTVELPFAPEKTSLPAAPSPPPPGERGDGRLLAGVRVLIVDHDLTLCEAFQAVLDAYGAEVAAVDNAPEALAVLERSRPDVLIFGDLAVRGEGVYDLMRDVAARTCPLPVASISAWRLEEQERELGAGFRLHLAKPLAGEALVDAVAALAGRTRPTPATLDNGSRPARSR